MNQFKKAKQLRAETGQATESITDLKTAGVAPKTNNINNDSEPTDAVPSNKEENKNEKTPQNTVEQDINKTLPLPVPQPDLDIKSNPLAENNVSENNTLKEGTSIIQTDNTENILPVTEKPSIMTQPDELPLSQPVVQPTQHTMPMQNPAATMQQAVITPAVEPIAIPQTAVVPTVESAAVPVFSTPTEYVNIPAAPPVTIQPVNESQIQDTAAPKHNKPTRKSAPNIFAPKGEAKSMRKSLVLKPTSVKIAENYCEKNGGSFNELIQTLLDNFIDEYGL